MKPHWLGRLALMLVASTSALPAIAADWISAALSLNSNDPRNLYFWPLFGKLDGPFQPTHLITGTRDRLLSDTVRMHAALCAANVAADLFVMKAMPHAGFGGMAPEERGIALLARGT
jgi:acetyl esterase/lipase